MKKYIKQFTFIFICFISLFMFGIDEVSADKLCDEDTLPIEGQSVSCTYNFFNGEAVGTLVFTNSSNNGYCATVKSQSYTRWFNSQKNGQKKGLISFDVSNDLIKNTVKNKACPTIKMVHEYDLASGKSTKVVYSEDTGGANGAACAFSYVVSAGSECAVNDGENLKELSANEVTRMITDQKTLESCDEDCITKIMNWAKTTKQKSTNINLGDSCDVINKTLAGYINTALLIISVVAIILLVGLTAVSIIKAITGSDDEKFRDIFKHLITRIIVVVILLILPSLVSFIIGIVNSNFDGKVQIGSNGDVYCGVTKTTSKS